MSSDGAPLVNLSREAQLQGSVVHHDSRPVFQFLGIPFAEPPVGGLRFKSPVPCKLWEGVRQATEYGNVPAQDLTRYEKMPIPFPIPPSCSEDCLYLNVWSPTLDPGAKLTVMVWIYGGAFTAGWSNMYRGTVFSAEHNVVFVSMNYRVGPFGFLCNDTSECNGNMGLMDQIVALRWVQQHVQQFGGDPDQVTIFGESAGGASVSLLLLSDLGEGLFHRAISQSGTSTTMGEMKPSSLVSSQIKSILSGAMKGETDLIKFLSDKSTELVLQIFSEIPWAPTRDGTIIKTNPREAYTKGDSRTPKEYLLGCNSHEGALYVLGPMAFLDFSTYQSTKYSVKALATRYIRPERLEEFSTSLLNYYVGKEEEGKSKDDIQKGMVKLMGDCLFVTPTTQAAMFYADRCPTYVYSFNHRPSFSPYPDWVHADHCFDIPYVLGDVMTPEMDYLKPSQDDVTISKTVMEYWANFAKTGNPNGDNLPDWPKFQKESRDFLEIGEMTHARNGFMKGRFELWMKEFSQIP